jgi:hypothetical protein
MKETIYAVWEEGFQEYCYKDTGNRVKDGVAVGYEENEKLFLYDNILFDSEAYNDM